MVASPPKIAPKSSASTLERAWLRTRGAFIAHPYFAYGGLAVTLVSLAIWGRMRMRRRRAGTPGYAFLDSKDSGFLGTSTNGKVD